MSARPDTGRPPATVGSSLRAGNGVVNTGARRDPLGGTIGADHAGDARPAGTGDPMHYCQACDEPVVMVADPPAARCPRCGSAERARTAPLFVVTGASGSGKTAVFPHLVDALPEFAVFDVDWLIDPLGRMCAGRSMDWVNFRDTWLSVAHAVAQSGRATVLLGPFFRDQLDPLPARQWVGPIHLAALDCSDAARRVRLDARPSWRERKIDEHVEFARHLRAEADVVIRTDDVGPAETASEVASWVRGERAAQLATGAPANGA